jgi:hypothetical protein
VHWLCVLRLGICSFKCLVDRLCVLPIYLFVAEKDRTNRGKTVIAGSSGCLVRVRTDSSSSW